MLFTLLSMIAIFFLVYLVGRVDIHAAHRMLETSQHFFEPAPDTRDRSMSRHTHARQRSKPTVKHRPHITPLVKKRVAARQKWRCAICKELFDETYEIDHIIPLSQGGHATAENNLQALCKRDHMFKSAVLDRS